MKRIPSSSWESRSPVGLIPVAGKTIQFPVFTDCVERGSPHPSQASYHVQLRFQAAVSNVPEHVIVLAWVSRCQVDLHLLQVVGCQKAIFKVKRIGEQQNHPAEQTIILTFMTKELLALTALKISVSRRSGLITLCREGQL